MKKRSLLVVCVFAATILNMYADITIRFWDNGELIHTAIADDNMGVQTLTTFYDKDSLQLLGYLPDRDGYQFEGWKKSSPLSSETASSTTAAIIRFDTIGTTNIDLYAVYTKDVRFFEKVTSSSGTRENGGLYMIVGSDGSNYYALGNTNISNEITPKAVQGTAVTPCDDKFYDVDNSLVWRGFSRSLTRIKYRNEGNSTELQLISGDYICGSSGVELEISLTLLTNEATISHTPNLWTSIYLHYTTNSKNYFGTGNTPAFVSANSTNSDWYSSGGNIYIYKASSELHYKSKFEAYSVQLMSCGAAPCNMTSITPFMATETSSPNVCGGCTYSGINTSSYIPTIIDDETDTWEFAGWATEPCANQTTPAPQYAANPYPLTHQNEKLYAVYHNTEGNYWSSYPTRHPYSANFYPENGKMDVVGHVDDVPYVATESVRGDGFDVPGAVKGCSPEAWTFAGWARNAIITANNNSAVIIPASQVGQTFDPVVNELDYHALYYREVSTGVHRYTSYPLCTPANITLDARNGTIDASHQKVITESGIGTGVTLEDATSPCSGTWNFAGWSRTIITPTNEEPVLFTSAETFYPIRDNEYLHAVYVRGDVRLLTWTSTPECAAFSAVFHACGVSGCGATVNGREVETLTEASVGAGITIPATATPSCPRWTFAGWKHGSPIDHTYTNPTASLLTTGIYHPSQNGEAFYAVYKHADINYWTSNPDCSPYAVYLHACEGMFGEDETIYDIDTLIAEAGAGITLPDVTPYCRDRGWNFEGWVEGGHLNTTNNLGGLTIRAAGSNYKPAHNNTHLYAVYSISGFKKVESTDDLIAGDTYVIAFFWDYGTAYAYSHFALSNKSHASETDCLNLKPIDEFTDNQGHKYVIEPGDSCKWILDGGALTGWAFRSQETNEFVGSLAATRGLGMSNVRVGYEINIEDGYIERGANDLLYKYWHFKNVGVNTLPNPTFYAYQDDNPDRCYLYHATGTVYSSWPHCQEYTVKFDGCDGMAVASDGVTLRPSITETEAGKGIILPTVTDFCEDWLFAGWAASPYDTLVAALDQNLYMPGAKYVPSKNNATLYAVYYKPRGNEFTLVSDVTGLYTGANYLIVHDHYSIQRALSNTPYATGNVDNYGISAEAVSISSGSISGSSEATHWRLEGYKDNYYWYNPAAGKYLDLATEIGAGLLPYASLQDVVKDHFTITHNGTYFLICSNINHYYLQKNEGLPLFKSSPFTTTYTYLYIQKADFWSYPCSQQVEPMRWGEGNMIVESLTHAGTPTSGSSRITGISAGEDGTYMVSFDSESSRKMRIKWGDNYYRMAVPFVASKNNTPAIENQPDQHLVILPNGSFTVDRETRLEKVSVYEDGELIIAGGETLYVDTLILRSYKGERHPVVSFGGNTAAIVISSGVIYHDLRIDDSDFFPFCLPYNVNATEISYVGLIPSAVTPTRGTNNYDAADYWIQYYDGVERTADANRGEGMKDTYWRVVVENTISGGTGYAIGISDAANAHRERTVRFKMTPSATWYNEQNGTSTRAVTISPSMVTTAHKEHSGWNFIGNPYVYNYYPGEASGSDGLKTGMWVKQANGSWKLDSETLSVPYFTFYSASLHDYYQVASNMARIQPFSAVFIQAEDEDKTMLMYEDPIHANEPSLAPDWCRARKETQPIVKTGILLAPSSVENFGWDVQREFDETGLVISNRFTDAYEVGADLVKQYNPSFLHIYTKNATHKLAFNALDEQTAAQPIQLGVTIPQTGSYTFRFDDRQYDREPLQSLLLTDNTAGETVDLLYDTYTCSINKGTNEKRFVLNAIIRKQDTPTDTESVMSSGVQVLTNENGSITICSSDKIIGMTVYDVAGRLLGDWTPNNYQWMLNLPQGVYAVSIKHENNQVTHIKLCSK